MALVTSSRAKIRPPYPASYWRPVDLRCGGFFGSELVCAIPRDTSEDSAGTSPAFWRDLEDWTRQRHAVEWPETQRNHHCAGNNWRQWQLSRGEKFWFARPRQRNCGKFRRGRVSCGHQQCFGLEGERAGGQGFVARTFFSSAI